jgi:transcriptional regulator with XRE-family HTH domain
MARARVPNLRRRRIERGIKSGELAEQLGVSRKHVTGVETGNQAASEELLYRMAAILEVDIDEIRDPTASVKAAS